MSKIASAARRLFESQPGPPKYSLSIVRVDGVVHTVPGGPREQGDAKVYIKDYYLEGFFVPTEDGFAWIPPSQIKRIDAHEVRP